MKNKNKITCNERGPLRPGVDVDYYEVSADGKVWPCCIFLGMHLLYNAGPNSVYKEVLHQDELFDKLHTEDENWNSLYHHSLEDITQNVYFTKHTNQAGWDSDNPPFVCKLCCGENAKGVKGYVRHVDNNKM